MISAIAWIPAGVADPNPKKYEFSAAEVELIKLMEQQNFDDLAEDGAADSKLENKKSKNKKSKLPKIENNLPADLRMDEYSSDEDENDAVQGANLGALLVDTADNIAEELEEDEADDNEDEMNDSDDSGDSDEDDDLADVPDTREYTPIDVEGLNDIGLFQAGMNAPSYMDGDDKEEDDDSAADDVNLKPDDALIVVAKTEEVSAPIQTESVSNIFETLSSLIQTI